MSLQKDSYPVTAADKPKQKANDLSGKDWTKLSISIWNDIKRTPEEARLRHPAMFPTELVRRLINAFCPPEGKMILDPFVGSGSTLVAAKEVGKTGIGFELNPEYCALAERRLSQMVPFAGHAPHTLYAKDARRLRKHLFNDTIDLAITSPPYWDVLSQKRTADYKQTRDYGNLDRDLATIADYREFIAELSKIFTLVKKVLKPGCYFIVNVMDLRKGDQFYCFHADLARKMSQAGWIFDDIIIWNRAQEYNNLRPLGFPYVFRINKVHEYLLVMRKPK